MTGSNGRTIDERLEAIADTIRNWDWRSAELRPLPAPLVPPSVVSPPRTDLAPPPPPPTMVESPVAATPTMPAEQTHGHVPERRPWSRPWVWATAAVVTLSLIAGAFVAAVGPFRHAGPHRNTVAAIDPERDDARVSPRRPVRQLPSGCRRARPGQRDCGLSLRRAGTRPGGGRPGGAGQRLSHRSEPLRVAASPALVADLHTEPGGDRRNPDAGVRGLPQLRRLGPFGCRPRLADRARQSSRHGTLPLDAALRQELGVPATATIP